MSRFLAASKTYHTKYKTAGSKKQISEARSACIRLDLESARLRYSSQAEADKAAFWFGMFTQDKAAEEKRAKLNLELQKEMDENARCEKLRAMAPLVMERRMVGVLAAMEGIRCYHYIKSESGSGMTTCDCIRVSPGVFKIADHHKPGTFYVDDRAVNRQIDIMKANKILTGKDLMMNPGGFGQQISESDHVYEAMLARAVLNKSSSSSSSSSSN